VEYRLKYFALIDLFVAVYLASGAWLPESIYPTNTPAVRISHYRINRMDHKVAPTEAKCDFIKSSFSLLRCFYGPIGPWLK
jgi:hypothetical protein